MNSSLDITETESVVSTACSEKSRKQKRKEQDKKDKEEGWTKIKVKPVYVPKPRKEPAEVPKSALEIKMEVQRKFAEKAKRELALKQAREEAAIKAGKKAPATVQNVPVKAQKGGEKAVAEKTEEEQPAAKAEGSVENVSNDKDSTSTETEEVSEEKPEEKAEKKMTAAERKLANYLKNKQEAEEALPAVAPTQQHNQQKKKPKNKRRKKNKNTETAKPVESAKAHPETPLPCKEE